MEEINIDIERLRQDLIDYFYAGVPIFPMVIMDIIEVETADYCKLIEIANNNGFNLNDYVISSSTKKLVK